MRIEWTEPALDDLEDIRDYIAQDSPQNAAAFIQRLFDAAERLGDFPHQGREVPEADSSPEDIRELIVQGYRIIYWPRTEVVQILAVVPGMRDLAGMTRKPWE